MSRWRIVVVALLTAVPFLFLALAGSYYLWQSQVGYLLWWPLAACLAAGYCLGWYWQHKRQLLRAIDFKTLVHWTERDRQAWKLIEARAAAAGQIDRARLGEVDFYFTTGKEMANELARFYNPGSRDPMGDLTIPEILTVLELAAQDLAEMVDRYLPGGHLLTINDWRLARQATDWYRSASNVYWLISALYRPVSTGLRYAASQVGMSQPLQMLQENLLVWFYTAFVHRTGTYLIDLNSGRLRVGARRYRELMQDRASPAAPARAYPAAIPADSPGDGRPPAADPVDKVDRVTLTLMGQVKTGKSSLINAFLGEQRALTDVLPATAEIARYELQPRGVPTRLVLLDTVGYAHTGPRADQLRATEQAAQQSDLVFLVLHARNPARRADLETLQSLRRWFAERPDLKMPPIVAVLTHIDLLSPSLEWAPPYDWRQPQRPKEQQIQQALAAVHEQLGDYLAGIVPVCSAPAKVFGIDEALLPAVSELLDEVHAVALLRCLRAEIDTGKVRKVFYQLLATGKLVVKLAWQNYQQTGQPPPR